MQTVMKKSCHLANEKDMRMQFVDLFSIVFVNKLMSANVRFLRFLNFKAFDLLKSYSY